MNRKNFFSVIQLHQDYCIRDDVEELVKGTSARTASLTPFMFPDVSSYAPLTPIFPILPQTLALLTELSKHACIQQAAQTGGLGGTTFQNSYMAQQATRSQDDS